VDKRGVFYNFIFIYKIIFIIFLLIDSKIVFAHERTVHISDKVCISIETARTSEERKKGLMFRRTISPKHGMLFDFGVSQPVSMWMKNTYISLDILFISEEGKITRIVPKTLPLSTEAIPSKAPVRFVLEIPAGMCQKYTILVGDSITELHTNKSKKPVPVKTHSKKRKKSS
jgi:uncharacterized membrane protein (UPF0127 family)